VKQNGVLLFFLPKGGRSCCKIVTYSNTPDNGEQSLEEPRGTPHAEATHMQQHHLHLLATLEAVDQPDSNARAAALTSTRELIASNMPGHEEIAVHTCGHMAAQLFTP
jgi:hypothetical protein